MKNFDQSTVDYLQRRAGNVVRVLIYIWAENKLTGEVEAVGFWNGDHPREFTIGSETRAYQPLPGKIVMDEVIQQPGEDVVYTNLTVSQLAQPIVDALTTYEMRFAPVQIHRALFWPETGELAGPPHRLFSGWIDRNPRPIPAVGEGASMTLSLANANRALTRTMPFKKSDATLQSARADGFRRYTDVGEVQVVWGEARAGS